MRRDLSPAAYAARRDHYQARGVRRGATWATLVAALVGVMILALVHIADASKPTRAEQIQRAVETFASRPLPPLHIECRAQTCAAWNDPANVRVTVRKIDDRWVVTGGVA